MSFNNIFLCGKIREAQQAIRSGRLLIKTAGNPQKTTGCCTWFTICYPRFIKA